MTELGVVFLPSTPPERLPGVAAAADEAGLEQLWLWEDCFKNSGVAAAAAALARTDRLRLGVGLLPVPLRNVALTAMEIATLDRMFPGRFVLGVGHGVQSWMAQVGARVESPLTLLREYVAALRSLLAGEQVSVDGRYVRLDAVQLDWPPAAAPGVLVGAHGPRSMRLTGEIGDGSIVDDPSYLAEAMDLIGEGRRAGGRTGAHTVVAFQPAATGPDAVERLRALAVENGLPDPDDFGAGGDAATIAAAVNRDVEAGADVVVLVPMADDGDPEDFVRFAAREVRPLVR